MKADDLLHKMTATSVEVKGCLKAMKWLYFVSLSTTTMTALNSFDRRRSSTKSIEMSFHTFSGTGSGCTRPPSAKVEYLWSYIPPDIRHNSRSVEYLSNPLLCLENPSVTLNFAIKQLFHHQTYQRRTPWHH